MRSVVVDLTTRHTLFTMVLGALIGHCAHAGLSQSMVQRYLSLATNKQAITAMWVFVAGISIFFTTSGLAGLIIYALHHDCDPVHAKVVSHRVIANTPFQFANAKQVYTRREQSAMSVHADVLSKSTRAAPRKGRQPAKVFWAGARWRRLGIRQR